MTKKDFFRLIIKLFGLYLLLTFLFSNLPGTVSSFFIPSEIGVSVDYYSFLWGGGSFIVNIGILCLLIFNPDLIIRMLSLDKGFDDNEIGFGNLNNENIIKLGLVIIGGVMLINNIPIFISYTFTAFKSSVSPDFENQLIKFTKASEYIAWGSSFFKALLGYIMVTKFNSISKVFSGNGKEGK